jgi:hypothetical protein
MDPDASSTKINKNDFKMLLEEININNDMLINKQKKENAFNILLEKINNNTNNINILNNVLYETNNKNFTKFISSFLKKKTLSEEQCKKIETMISDKVFISNYFVESHAHYYVNKLFKISLDKNILSFNKLVDIIDKDTFISEYFNEKFSNASLRFNELIEMILEKNILNDNEKIKKIEKIIINPNFISHYFKENSPYINLYFNKLIEMFFDKNMLTGDQIMQIITENNFISYYIGSEYSSTREYFNELIKMFFDKNMLTKNQIMQIISQDNFISHYLKKNCPDTRQSFNKLISMFWEKNTLSNKQLFSLFFSLQKTMKNGEDLKKLLDLIVNRINTKEIINIIEQSTQSNLEEIDNIFQFIFYKIDYYNQNEINDKMLLLNKCNDFINNILFSLKPNESLENLYYILKLKFQLKKYMKDVNCEKHSSIKELDDVMQELKIVLIKSNISVKKQKNNLEEAKTIQENLKKEQIKLFNMQKSDDNTIECAQSISEIKTKINSLNENLLKITNNPHINSLADQIIEEYKKKLDSPEILENKKQIYTKIHEILKSIIEVQSLNSNIQENFFDSQKVLFEKNQNFLDKINEKIKLLQNQIKENNNNLTKDIFIENDLPKIMTEIFKNKQSYNKQDLKILYIIMKITYDIDPTIIDSLVNNNNNILNLLLHQKQAYSKVCIVNNNEIDNVFATQQYLKWINIKNNNIDCEQQRNYLFNTNGFECLMQCTRNPFVPLILLQKCGHTFCQECCSNTLITHQKCPLCSTTFNTGELIKILKDIDNK